MGDKPRGRTDKNGDIRSKSTSGQRSIGVPSTIAEQHDNLYCVCCACKQWSSRIEWTLMTLTWMWPWRPARLISASVCTVS